MIRALTENDRACYLAMAKTFYESDAVLASVPSSHIEATFDRLMAGTPFADAFILEWEGTIAGYALLAHTWSQEAGGPVVWLEELFVLPEFRSLGLGREFFSYLEEHFPEARRFRLEVEEENEGAVHLYQKRGFSFFPYKQMKKDF